MIRFNACQRAFTTIKCRKNVVRKTAYLASSDAFCFGETPDTRAASGLDVLPLAFTTSDFKREYKTGRSGNQDKVFYCGDRREERGEKGSKKIRA